MYFRTSKKLKECGKRNDTISKKIHFIGVLNKQTPNPNYKLRR